jgi:dTDP-6-deoxy-L-talose 4-dehydrogenase (NAD+)
MKKILVTGATGFIGQYVIDELLHRGHQVIASSAHPDKAMQTGWYSKVEYKPFNLTGFDPAIDYYRFFGEPDQLIHLAWEGLPNYKALFHLESNFPRHAAFLENMVRHGLGDITVSGTCLEYGMQEGVLREDMKAMPVNSYAQAKDSLRMSLEELQKEHPFVLKWVRLFYMYGKGQNPNSLLSQLDKALAEDRKSFNMSGGEQVRDFLPVEKVADYLVRISMQQKITGIINCCSGRPVTVKRFVEDYLIRINKDISLNLGFYPYADYEPMQFWGDTEKLNTIQELLTK